MRSHAVIGTAFSLLNFVRILASLGGPRWKETHDGHFLKGAAAAVIVMPRCERTPYDVSGRAPYSFLLQTRMHSSTRRWFTDSGG